MHTPADAILQHGFFQQRVGYGVSAVQNGPAGTGEVSGKTVYPPQAEENLIFKTMPVVGSAFEHQVGVIGAGAEHGSFGAKRRIIRIAK